MDDEIIRFENYSSILDMVRFSGEPVDLPILGCSSSAGYEPNERIEYKHTPLRSSIRLGGEKTYGSTLRGLREKGEK
jgi:hypothetical protein